MESAVGDEDRAGVAVLGAAYYPRNEEVSKGRLLVRFEQQAAIAAFGQKALVAADPGTLLAEAAQQAAACLGATHAKVLQKLPDGSGLLLRAGVGWPAEEVGTAVLGADIESPAGFALKTGRPVLAPDLAAESRFRWPRLLQAHGLRCAINVLIDGESGPFGVLEVDSPQPYAFDADDTHFLQSLANMLAAAVERQRITDLLVRKTEEATVLLREVQHRVKNNLQVMSSLIALQERSAATDDGRRQLATVGNRVRAMSVLFDQLYVKIGASGRLDLGDYLRALADNLAAFHELGQTGIALRTHFERVPVDIDAAVPLGLIANEFIANSLEHAFPEERGTITVRPERIAADRARLTLADDGIGCSGAPKPTGGGLGLRLIPALAAQASATLEWSGAGGTRATLVFPLR